MYTNITCRTKVIGLPNHRERLVAKRREGREPAENTDHRKSPEIGPEQLPGFHEAGEYSDQKAEGKNGKQTCQMPFFRC